MLRYSLLGDYEEEEDDEISPDLWQEACWIVIRCALSRIMWPWVRSGEYPQAEMFMHSVMTPCAQE